MLRTRVTPGNNPQVVAVSSSSTQSTAFAAGSHYARLVSTVNCYVAFGTNPTATSSSLYMVANVPEFFGITPAQKVAVLRVSGDGSLSVVEGTAL